VKFFRSPLASFANEVVECLFEAAHLHLTPSRRLCYAATPPDLPTRSLSGPALGMALASACAISGLSQTELCSSIYGTHFQEDPVQVLSLSECIPPDFFLNRWMWSDLSSEALLLIPLDVHYERLLHERHWTIGHNACKGAKTDLPNSKYLDLRRKRQT